MKRKESDKTTTGKAGSSEWEIEISEGSGTLFDVPESNLDDGVCGPHARANLDGPLERGAPVYLPVWLSVARYNTIYNFDNQSRHLAKGIHIPTLCGLVTKLLRCSEGQTSPSLHMRYWYDEIKAGRKELVDCNRLVSRHSRERAGIRIRGG